MRKRRKARSIPFAASRPLGGPPDGYISTPDQMQAIADCVSQMIVGDGLATMKGEANFDHASGSGTFELTPQFADLVKAIEAQDRDMIRRILAAAGGLSSAEIEAMILEKLGPK